jgi:uncharacterized Ntn-hydrolase superfamily protein
VTYSIVARDPGTGALGVAVQSHWFSVGTVVTWAEAGVGAIATQAHAEPAYGPHGLALMRNGNTAQGALDALVRADDLSARRQVAFVDAHGGVAVHTGSQCIADAGHATGDGVSVQANMMRTRDVWPAMLDAYQAAEGDLAERLLQALEAGERAGGDVRGRQSAALLIVGAERNDAWRARIVDLRVDDSADPLVELRRLLDVHRAYSHMEVAEQRQLDADVDGALAAYERARALLRGNDEAAFWTAVLLAEHDRFEDARAMLREISAHEPGWRTLVERLPAAGLLDEARARDLLA